MLPPTKRQMVLPPVEFKELFHGLGLRSNTLFANEHHLLLNSYGAPALEDFQHWTEDPRLPSDPHMSSLHIDVTQDAGAFSIDSVYRMKRAADFLAAIFFNEDAFTLYVLILKRLRTSPGCPELMITWTVISCSRTAHSDGQLEIARSFLKQRLSECSGAAPLVDNFVTRMLLADTY